VPNKYLYNKKELISDLSLEVYDYGARQYDPAIGRCQLPVISTVAGRTYNYKKLKINNNNCPCWDVVNRWAGFACRQVFHISTRTRAV